MANDTIRKCSFCGKPEDKVRTLFSAGTSHICDECVLYCYNVLAERSKTVTFASTGVFEEDRNLRSDVSLSIGSSSLR